MLHISRSSPTRETRFLHLRDTLQDGSAERPRPKRTSRRVTSGDRRRKCSDWTVDFKVLICQIDSRLSKNFLDYHDPSSTVFLIARVTASIIMPEDLCLVQLRYI